MKNICWTLRTRDIVYVIRQGIYLFSIVCAPVFHGSLVEMKARDTYESFQTTRREKSQYPNERELQNSVEVRELRNLDKIRASRDLILLKCLNWNILRMNVYSDTEERDSTERCTGWKEKSGFIVDEFSDLMEIHITNLPQNLISRSKHSFFFSFLFFSCTVFTRHDGKTFFKEP